MSFSSECCVLLDRRLCDGPITHPEESSRVWCVCVYVCVCVIKEAHIRGHYPPACISGDF